MTTFPRFSFSQKKQPEEPPPPPIQLAEQNIISEIPESARNDFSKVWMDAEKMEKEISDANKELTDLHLEAHVAGDPDPLSDLSSDTKYELLTSLRAFAHRIDAARARVDRLQTELHESRANFNDAANLYQPPPRAFISRYVRNVMRAAKDLDVLLRAHIADPDRHTMDTTKIVADMLSEQHSAMMRCAARFHALTEMEREIEKQYRMRDSVPERRTEAPKSAAADIAKKFDAFDLERKRTAAERLANSNLFGVVPSEPAKAFGSTSTFGGSSLSRGSFGSGTASPLARTSGGALGTRTDTST
jgi:hypothetical protein